MSDLARERSELAKEVFLQAGWMGIRYALMRNSREVAAGTAKDADILVTEKDLDRFSLPIAVAVRRLPDWSVIQVVRRRHGRREVLLHRRGGVLAFDLRSAVRLEAGAIPARVFLAGTRVSREGVRILEKEDFLTCLCIHHRRRPKPEYGRILESAFREDRDLAGRVAGRVEELGARYRGGEFSGRLSRLADFRFWRNYLSPRGIYAVVNGPDGVGKTTALAELQGRLDRMGISFRIKHLGGKTGMLPERPFKGRDSRGSPSGAPESAGPPRRWPAALDLPRLIYHFLDIQLYHWGVIRRFSATGGWFVADKFFTYAVKSRSMGFAVPEALVRFLYRLLPRPDLFILLWNDPEEVARRKGELTPREAAGHALVLERLSRRSRRRLLIKTDRPAAAVAGEILEGLVRRGTEKASR